MSDRDAIRAVLRKWVSAATVCSPVDGAAADMLTDRAIDDLTPLLVARGQDHRVLWTGPTRKLSNTDESEIYVQLPVSAGTVVAVVTRDATEET